MKAMMMVILYIIDFTEHILGNFTVSNISHYFYTSFEWRIAIPSIALTFKFFSTLYLTKHDVNVAMLIRYITNFTVCIFGIHTSHHRFFIIFVYLLENELQ